MKRMRVRGKHVILSLVCLVLGFILAFSFSLANTEQAELGNRTNGQWKQEEALRDQILEYQQINNNLQEELYEKQEKVPGVKFADAELVGVPTILVVGRGLANGVVEVKDRRTGDREEIAVDAVVEHLVKLVRS